MKGAINPAGVDRRRIRAIAEDADVAEDIEIARCSGILISTAQSQ